MEQVSDILAQITEIAGVSLSVLEQEPLEVSNDIRWRLYMALIQVACIRNKNDGEQMYFIFRHLFPERDKYPYERDVQLWEEQFIYAHEPKYQEEKQREMTERATGLWHENRKKALCRDCYKCALCGSGEELCIHHIRPLYLGGTHYIDNLITLCQSCHLITHGKEKLFESKFEKLTRKGQLKDWQGLAFCALEL